MKACRNCDEITDDENFQCDHCFGGKFRGLTQDELNIEIEKKLGSVFDV